jgi:hypothetical protein
MKDSNKKKIDKFKSSLMDSFDQERVKDIDMSIEGYLDKFEHLGQLDIPDDTKDVIKQIKILQMKNDTNMSKASDMIRKIERMFLEKQ